MLLRALASFASDDRAPLGYALKRSVGFELRLGAGGEFLALSSLHELDEKGKLQPQSRQVPTLKRSNNPPPLLGCDTAAYVLGRPKPAATAATAAAEAAEAEERQTASQKNAAFLRLLLDYAEASGDVDVAAYETWARAGMPGLNEAVEELDPNLVKRLDQDLIIIRVGASTALHAKKEAQAFWGEFVQAKAKGTPQICVSCGQVRLAVETLPQSLVGSQIPRTSASNVALMSVNFGAASRGASGKGLKSSPVCAACATAAVSTFNELSSRGSKHLWRGATDEPSSIWWSNVPVDEDFLTQLEDPRPEPVHALFHSAERGRRSTFDEDAERLYLLSFSGNVARLVVHRWLDLKMSKVQESVRAWFDDVAGTDRERPYPPLRAMAESAGPFTAGKGSAPDGSREALLLTALTGTAPPRSLLLNAVHRARAECRYWDDPDGLTAYRYRKRMQARMGLIRLVINRTTERSSPMARELDEDRGDKAYLSGRLFAVRQSTQYAASQGVNATIVDRYFERASANPASVDHALTTLEIQHVKAIRRKGEDARAGALERRLRELHARLQDAPGRLSVPEQAAWIAGYFQQREHDFAAAAQAKAARDAKTTDQSNHEEQ